jgi:hypothetical protein
MADRARRYEREVRRVAGVTAAAQRLLDGTHPVVQAGPFAGMAYPPHRLADVDAAAAKLLGVYEQEIAWVFERAIVGNVSNFIDIGCADGYYAVGMACASPTMTTFAYDLSSSARALCAEVATASGVGTRVRIGKRCSADVLGSLPVDRALVLCDIEGAEVELLDAVVAETLATSVVVVEVHEAARPGAGGQLQSAFAGTHEAVTVFQQPREVPEPLAAWPLRERSIALTEFRDPRLHWIVFEPIGRALQ